MSVSPDHQPPPGVVELREDVPLKAGAGGADSGRCAGGPRLILAAFAALSVAITLALLTQIYYGDYEVVSQGAVSASGAACSRSGTRALRAGGRALDAAAAAALCLALHTPHRTSLDASGSLLYWEYRTSRSQPPTLVEWGGARAGGASDDAARPPRLLAALAALHARYGVLPWPSLLQPTIDMARAGFLVSEDLSAAAAARGLTALDYEPRELRQEPALADYLETLQLNSSAELCAAWKCDTLVQWSSAAGGAAGAWRVWAGGAGGRVAASALAAALPPSPAPQPTALEAFTKVVAALQQQAVTAGEDWPSGVASGLAVVDQRDTYAALVTGLSAPFGSGGLIEHGWARDSPHAPLDLAPAIIVDENVCGTRYVIGAESGAALAQGAAAALAGGAGAGGGGAGAADGVSGAVEAARVALAPGGALALEALHAPLAPPAALPAPPALNATPPYAAVNLVQQRGDGLASHADSRGGGLASRFGSLAFD